jgi:D-amino-acid oxidase
MASKALVVGSGAVGLRTALELVRRNVSVVLRAPCSPLDPSNTSQGAGGLWMPFHCDDPRTFRWAQETLNELLPMATRQQASPHHQESERGLVEVVPAVYLMRNHGGPTVEHFIDHSYEPRRGQSTETLALPGWTKDPRLEFQHLTVEMLSWQNIINRLKIPPEEELKQAGYLYAWFFKPPIVNTSAMLTHMLNELKEAGADVNVESGHYYSSLDEMRNEAAQLDCDCIVNATGLGAKEILHDDKMVGARGTLLHYDREDCPRRDVVRDGPYGINGTDAVIMTEEAPWGSDTLPCYLIPRGKSIVVGGSYLEEDKEPSIRNVERDRLLQNASNLGINTEKARIIGEWTGFRPYRPTARCELDLDSTSDIRIVHSYGYGGSGWTVNVGAAVEAVDLLIGTKKL